MKIAYLEISNWTGLSLGAVHYYGKLVCDGQRIQLKKELSRAEALFLSRDWHWEKGDTTERFCMKGELKDLAIRTWRDHFPDAIMLIEGRAWLVEPQHVLDGPAEIKRRINALAAEAEKVDYWDDEVAMQRICDEWDAIMGR